MSQVARLFLASGLSLVIGAGGGAYAMSLLYGGPPEAQVRVDPSPDPVAPECPACPECPVCPPPPDCGELGVLPEDDLPVEPVDGPRAEPPELPSAAPSSGLPVSAVQKATAAVREAVTPCLEAPEAEAARGMVLLSLTVTATGGQGFIRDALVTQRTGDVAGVEACIQSEARRAKFEWAGADGEQSMRLPIPVQP